MTMRILRIPIGSNGSNHLLSISFYARAVIEEPTDEVEVLRQNRDLTEYRYRTRCIQRGA